MKLKRKNLSDSFWQNNSIETPSFDIEAVINNTRVRPTWIHFGAGNIFRVYIAKRYQELLNKGQVDTGIIALQTSSNELADNIFKPYDNLTLSVIMHKDGRLENSIVASITDIYNAVDDAKRLEEIFANPSLQIASFTITEKGYALKGPDGNYLSIVQENLKNPPEKSTHAMSILTKLLNDRYKAGSYPISILSLDNCSHNGDKIKEAVLDIANHWLEKGYVDKGFLNYLSDKNLVAFPLSMIDKITPRPSEEVAEKLKAIGIEDMKLYISKRKSYSAPFVNSEVCEYLVIEDLFPNGRAQLEDCGVLFGDRDTINKVETMKVTTCLNPLHTALAVAGCVLGYKSIWEEMSDKHLLKLIKKIGYDEGLPVVVDPKILSPKKFIDEVVNERLVNPYIPDTPARIATDTSQKVGIRYGKTIQAYLDSKGKYKIDDLVGIPLAIAIWIRYLLGLNDNLENMEISADPMLEYLSSITSKIKIGDKKIDLKGILDNTGIFGHNLYEIGLGEKIEKMVLDMIKGKGALRDTLAKYLD